MEANIKFCQSCCMPMDSAESMWGTEADGSASHDYCIYCYKCGAFTSNSTMEEMLEFCIPIMVKNGMVESEARRLMQESLPKLKRWKR